MGRLKPGLSLFLLAIVTSALSPALGQEPERPINLRGELVVLDAQVVGKKTSQPIRDLSVKDFSLFEDGVKQHISHFSRDRLPLSVLILFDVSGSVWPDSQSFDRLRRGALEALNQLKPEDEVALMQFAQHRKVLQPFTKDRVGIIDALGRLDGTGERGTLVNEAVYDAATYMRKAANPDSRRVIIGITDDLTTVLPGTTQGIAMLRTEAQTLHELSEEGVVVCGLLCQQALSAEEATITHTNSSSISSFSILRSGLVESYARQTGGLAFRVKYEGIAAKLAELIERLRHRYSLGYTPSNTSHDHKYRRIKLEVNPGVAKQEGGVAVITRRGYYSK